MLFRAVLALILALTLAPRAEARTWSDPSFAELVASARLICELEALPLAKPKPGAKPASQDELLPSFKVHKLYKGKPITPRFRIGNLYDPERSAPPPIKAGERFIAFLHVEAGVYRVPTPTYGLFPIKFGRVIASIRDTSVRVGLPRAQYDAFLGAVLARLADPEHKKGPPKVWIKELRAQLDGCDWKRMEQAKAAEAHLALEALAWFGEAEDRPRLEAALSSELYQLRVSAVRALGRIGDAPSRTLLAARLADDKVLSVRNSAALALCDALERLSPLPPSELDALIALAPKAPAEEVRLHLSVEDPRTNIIPPARISLLRFLGARAEPRALPVFLAAIESDDGELLRVGLACLLKLKQPALAAELIDRFRKPGAKGFDSNHRLGEALTRLTGQDFGADAAAWRAWWDKSRPQAGPPAKSRE